MCARGLYIVRIRQYVVKEQLIHDFIKTVHAEGLSGDKSERQDAKWAVVDLLCVILELNRWGHHTGYSFEKLGKAMRGMHLPLSELKAMHEAYPYRE